MSVLSTNQLRYVVTVLRVVHETFDVATLYFAPPLGFHYAAGQYITVFFDDTDVPEGKAYSLSSHPGEADLSITVKKIGLFSGRLHSLKPGDKLAISPAYGMFNAFGEAPLVAVAAGVGIAPIYSIIRHEIFTGSHRPMQLLYTNATDEEIAFKGELDRLMQSAPEFSVRYIVTRRPDSPYYSGRISGADILRDFPGRAICLCGTVEFVRDMRKQLVAAGASDDAIMTEVFFAVNKGVQ